MQSAAQAFAHCEELVRAQDRDRYLASLFAPQDKRAALFALYAFDNEIARIRDTVRDPMPGEIRMQWWREVIEGKRDGEGAANPVSAALLEIIAGFALPREALLNLLEARSFDLYSDPMPSLAALVGYGEKVHGTIIACAARILGDELPWPLVSAAGFVATLSDIVRHVPRYAARGQFYWPIDMIEKHGGTFETVLAGEAASALNATQRELMAEANDRLAAARGFQPDAASPVWVALLPLVPSKVSLERASQNADPYRPHDVPQWRKQWQLWRAARKPGRILQNLDLKA